MPYFERKPWQAAVLDQIDPVAVTPDSDVDFVGIAQSILSDETHRKHALDGPFRCANAVHPGQTGVIVLSVAADTSGGPLTLDLSPSDLRSSAGETIPSNMISVDPVQLTIPPGKSSSFEISVIVPIATSTGLYSGRIIGSGPEPISFVIEIVVTETAKS